MPVDKHIHGLVGFNLEKTYARKHAQATNIMPTILTCQCLVSFQLTNIHALKVYTLPSVCAWVGFLTIL